MENVLDDTLIVFVKYPQPGFVKTRLAKDIGKEKAASLYRFFVETILVRTEDKNFSRLIFYTPARRKIEIIDWLGPKLDMGPIKVMNKYMVSNGFYPQLGRTLGERLSIAFKFAFKRGAKRVVAIGSDSPLLDKKVILEAFKKLRDSACVLGPTLDGGYYLIGLGLFKEEIFKRINWGTDSVLKQTIIQLKRLEMNYSLLDKSFDVDTYHDILLLKRKLKTFRSKNLVDLGHIIRLLSRKSARAIKVTA